MRQRNLQNDDDQKNVPWMQPQCLSVETHELGIFGGTNALRCMIKRHAQHWTIYFKQENVAE
jgi:hypothetical protein